MRYKTTQKQASRQKIIDAAGRLFRSRGIASTGVDAVMSAVGLTPGGFYNHFKSKQTLVAEVLRQTMQDNRERLTSGLEQVSDQEWIAGLVGRYVSRSHRDQPESGCPIPSLSGELRHIPEAPAILAEELEAYLTMMTQRLPGRPEALVLLATMVGAVSLARALKDTPLGDEVLAACRSVRP